MLMLRIIKTVSKVVIFMWVGVIFTLFVSSVNRCYGQQITEIQPIGNNFQMRIDGNLYLAIPWQTAQEILRENEELEAARKKLAVKDSLIAAYEKTYKTYVKNFELQNELLVQTHQLYEGYKDLAKNYKRVHGEAFLRFNGGLGAIREKDTEDVVPIILLGVSLRRLNIWSYLSTEQSGFIFGANLPLRFSLF